MNTEYPKFVWAVIPNKFNGCIDIRRYAHTHAQAVKQLSHNRNKKSGYFCSATNGKWTLFKLVRVNKRRAK